MTEARTVSISLETAIRIMGPHKYTLTITPDRVVLELKLATGERRIFTGSRASTLDIVLGQALEFIGEHADLEDDDGGV